MATHPTIGVVMAALAGYYWGGILAGMQRVAQQHGAQLIVIQGTSQDIQLHGLASDIVDGWIAVHYDEGIHYLAAQGRPLVTATMLVPGLACPAVLADNRAGTAVAVRHLIGHGHSRIAFVGWLDQSSIQQRFEGYCDALAEHGIPFDPRAVIHVGNNWHNSGRAGAQQLIEQGMPCTAIVAGTDLNAIGILEALLEAGYRVPEDVAVVGFDDINPTQFTNPPLTTVRTRFDELGATALGLLLAKISGESVQPGPVYVPALLVPRRSCGCSVTVSALTSNVFAAAHALDWQAALVHELVRLALSPIEPDPTRSPMQIWPGAATLLAGLEAVLVDGRLPAASDLARAWQEAIVLTPDLEILSAMIAVLENVGRHLLVTRPDAPDLSSRLDAFIACARLDMLRARVARETNQIRTLETLTQNNYEISMTLLSADSNHVQQLAWLAGTPVRCGCLALHSDRGADLPGALVVAGTYHRDGDAMPPIGNAYAASNFPPPEFLATSGWGNETDIVILLPIKTAARDWGMLALCAPIENQFTSDRPNIGMWGPLLSAALERNVLQAEIAEQQDTLSLAYQQRLITENIRDLIGMLDQHGRYLYASPSYRTVLGYDPAALMGAALFDYAHPDDLAGLRELWTLILVAGTAQGTFRARHAGGDWRWLEIAGTAIVRAGAPSVVIVSRDVTERRQLEAELLQSQKMESIGRLAGGVAHDFNNMLTAIGGYANLAIEGLPADCELHGDLEEIQKATARAANLTRQLLAFARKQLIEPKVLNLNDLILDMNKLLCRVIGENIELIGVLAPDLGCVRVDPSQIEQVLVNLAVNARDAMSHGGMLTIETANTTLGSGAIQHAEVADGPYVLLAVSDTGIGMSAELKRHLFEPFFTTKPIGQGTGLGLATCYGIVKRHAGYIWPYSEVGQGTTIKIYLPRVEEPAEARALAIPTDEPLHGTEVVLLVEDDAAVRTLTARVLRAHRYTVLEANDGEHALQIALAHAGQIALLLSDVVMPRMSGKELADQLALARVGIKVLFMSGYTDNVLVRNDRLDSQVEFLHKPFTPAALTRKVRKVLDA
jgi:PAS domain S-box-containing protein